MLDFVNDIPHINLFVLAKHRVYEICSYFESMDTSYDHDDGDRLALDTFMLFHHLLSSQL